MTYSFVAVFLAKKGGDAIMSTADEEESAWCVLLHVASQNDDVKLKKCNVFKLVRYGSTKCQKEHRWSKHKNQIVQEKSSSSYVYTWNHPSWRLPKSTLQAKWSSRLFSCQSTTSVERITGYRQHFIIDDKIADKKFMASQIPTRELGKTYYRKEGLYAMRLNIWQRR